jgi:hypothetical protein
LYIENLFFLKDLFSENSKPWQTLYHFNNVKCYFFLCLVLPDILALQTAYGLTFFPDLRLTFDTHLSNFLELSPFFTALGMNVYIQHF